MSRARRVYVEFSCTPVMDYIIVHYLTSFHPKTVGNRASSHALGDVDADGARAYVKGTIREQTAGHNVSQITPVGAA